MKDDRIFCDKCKKRVDDIASDGIAYYVISPVQGHMTAHAIGPLPPDLWIEMYKNRHYCHECFPDNL